MPVRHTIHGLAADLAAGPSILATEKARAVQENVQRGARLTKRNAASTAREHGRRYVEAIDWELTAPAQGEWGPDSSMPQGGMEFERGSRNQPAHLDHHRAALVVVPQFHRDARGIFDKVFWR